MWWADVVRASPILIVVSFRELVRDSDHVRPPVIAVAVLVPFTVRAPGQLRGAPAAEASQAAALGWAGWAGRASGPERSRAPQMTAPAA